MRRKKKNKMISILVGSVLLITGIAMILAWWPHVVHIFKGILGFVVALAGLLILYMIKE
jgi:uncharacterized membrane protein